MSFCVVAQSCQVYLNDMNKDFIDGFVWTFAFGLFLACLLGGCNMATGRIASSKPRQDEASLIALTLYGNPELMPPHTYWRGQDELDCTDGKSWNEQGDCVMGAFWPESFKYGEESIDLADWGEPLHDSALAHETCHFWWLHTQHTGDGDINHTGPCFNAVDGRPSLTDQARALIAAAGM